MVEGALEAPMMSAAVRTRQRMAGSSGSSARCASSPEWATWDCGSPARAT